MIKLPQILGNQLIRFLEEIGCNKRFSQDNVSVLWSVYTGDFFVVPEYKNEFLDNLTLEHIIWQLGITQEAFLKMWCNFKNI